MRISTARVAVLVFLIVAMAACSPSDEAPSDALASQVESLEGKLSDTQRTIAEQQLALDEAQGDIASLTEIIETQAVIEEKQTEATAEAARLLREAQEVASRIQEDVEILRNLACASVERDLPARVPSAFVDWLVETQSEAGEIPSDMKVTIVEAAGREGDWVFFARFDTRFEPGLFSRDSDGNFEVLWGGMAPSEAGIWNYLSEAYPDGDTASAACLDLSFFVE